MATTSAYNARNFCGNGCHRGQPKREYVKMIGKQAMSKVSLSLLVLKTQQVEKLRVFYSMFGIEFCEEQHGTGPTHFAGQLQDTVFEIYPLAEREQPDSSTRIGFVVDDLNFVLESLWRHQFCKLKKAKQTEWGYRAVVRDPDGRAIELYQRPQ